MQIICLLFYARKITTLQAAFSSLLLQRLGTSGPRVGPSSPGKNGDELFFVFVRFSGSSSMWYIVGDHIGLV